MWIDTTKMTPDEEGGNGGQGGQGQGGQEEENKTYYDIIWVLGDGRIDETKYDKRSTYEKGVGLVLPKSDEMIAPSKWSFTNWTIGDAVVTEISKDSTGPVVVTANWSRIVEEKEVITLGKYPYENSNIKNDLEWIVLARSGDNLLLTTRYIIDNQKYNNSNLFATIYKECSLRDWLNNEFIETAFDNVDTKFILDTRISDGVTDKVFLLSEEEVNNYFVSEEERTTSATQYAKNINNGGAKLFVSSNGKSYYWLRDISSNKVSIVSHIGKINSNAMYPYINTVGVRPAMWVNQTSMDELIGQADIYYPINWELGDGSFSSDYNKPETYKKGEGLELPGNKALIPPEGQAFDYWTIGGSEEKVTCISSSSELPVTVYAHWTRKIDKGEVVVVGEYPQEDPNITTAKQDLEWIVIHSDGDNVLLTTKYIIDNQSYNDELGNIQYENSSIRSWLNGTFVNTAFTNNEIDKVLSTDVGNGYKDKIFLLTEAEAKAYMASDVERATKATDYAKSVNNNGFTIKVANDGNSDYWLRDRADRNNSLVVTNDGRFNNTGLSVNNRETGVRPAMWMSHSVLKEHIKPVEGDDPENPIIYYNIYWNLGDAKWVDGFTPIAKYKKGEEVDIPTADKLVISGGRIFAYWSLKDSNKIRISPNYKIESDAVGPITITANLTRNVGEWEIIPIGKYASKIKDTGTATLEWQVLAREGSKALVTTVKVIDTKPFDNEHSTTTWADSTIRQWLNGSFYENTFTDYEKQYIFDSEVVNRSNSVYNTDSGVDTVDKVFLLSEDEVKSYFSLTNITERAAKPSGYAKTVDGSEIIWSQKTLNGNYWLRTIGEDNTKATYLRYDGATITAGDDITSMKNGVRPAMWVDADKIVMEQNTGSSLANELSQITNGLFDSSVTKAAPATQAKEFTIPSSWTLLEDRPYNTTADIWYAMFWNYNGGYWDPEKFDALEEEPYKYKKGVGLDLPDPKNIIAPEGYEFAFYSIDANRDGVYEHEGVTSVSPEFETGITVKFNWKRKINTGEIVKIGEYSQNDTTGFAKDPIEWIVVGKENDNLLVLAKEIIDNKCYKDEYVHTSWETSTIRTWLNNQFYNEAFSEDEKAEIITEDDILHNGFSDRVFVLSEEQANKYFANDTLRAAMATKYAKNIINNGGKLEVANNGNSPYWLRTVGETSTKAMDIDTVGAINTVGTTVTSTYDGVRPAMWVKESKIGEVKDMNGDDPNKKIYYNITWDMGEGSFANTYDVPTKYEKGVGLTLPRAIDLVAPKSYAFDYWTVDGEETNAISNTKETAVVVKANWKQVDDTVPNLANVSTYSQITWELNGGDWNNYVATTSYAEGIVTKLPTKDNVKKDDNVLQGWHINGNAETVSYISSTQTGDITVSAVWVSNRFKATFDAGEGSFSDGSKQIVKDVVYGDKLADIYPANPIKENSPFIGWRVNGLVNAYNYYEFTDNMTFTAVYEEAEIKVMLDAGIGKFANGRNTRTTYIKKGADTSIFETPTAYGYDFDDYYINGEKISSEWSIVTDEVVKVEARFKPHTYRIIYEGTHATEGRMDVQVATYGETYNLYKNQFKRNGYVFVGWLYDGVPGGILFDGQEISNLTTIDNAEIRLTAAWVAMSIKINYEPNGADSMNTMPQDSYEIENNKKVFGLAKIEEDTDDIPAANDALFGKQQVKMDFSEVQYGLNGVKLNPNRYQRRGYNFLGWGLSPDSTVVYSDKAELNLNDMYEEEITLYALWEKEEGVYATLFLDANNGEPGPAKINGVDTAVIYLRRDEVVPKPTMYRPGYTFDYWTDAETGARVDYPEVCDFEGPRSLEAHWKPINYTLRFYDNFGDNKYIEIDATYDMIYKTPATSIVERPKATLLGWSPIMNTKQKAYSPDVPISNLATKQGQIINYYAVWQTDDYIINQHGLLPQFSNQVAVKQFTYGEAKRITGIYETIATFNNVSCVFGGWTTEPNGKEIMYLDADIADRIYENEKKSEIDLYPVWVNQYNALYIIFDGNGGTVKGDDRWTTAFEVGQKISYPGEDKLNKSGYALKQEGNWVDKDGKVFNEEIAQAPGELHLYANWEQKTYTIEYVGIGDGVIANSMTTDNSVAKVTAHGGEDINIAYNDYFERVGYNFIGWDTSADGAAVVYKEGAKIPALGEAGQVIRLYSVWQPKTFVIRYVDSDGVMIGTNSFVYDKNVRIIPNKGISDDSRDAGFIYEVNGQKKRFSSGQSIDSDDLGLANIETKKINDTFSLNNSIKSNNIFEPVINVFGGFLNSLIGNDDEEVLPSNNKVFGDGIDLSNSTGYIELKGNKTKAVYTLTFNANGGVFSDGTDVKIATVSTGDKMATKWPANPTSSTGFAGWAVLDNGEELEYVDETYIYTAPMIFVAKWDRAYTARLYANQGIFADGTDTQMIPIARNDSTDIFEIPVRTGYEFKNYYVHDRELTTTWNYYANDITDVVAEWTPINYNIIYDANGAFGNMKPGVATYGEAYALEANGFTKDGYRFDGWDVNGTIMQPTDTILNLTHNKNENIVVKATWSPLQYTVVYNGNGGRGAMTAETGLVYGREHKLKENRFSKANAKFRGWSLATSSDVRYFDKATLSTAQSYKPVINLYAQWLDDTEDYGVLKLYGNTGSVNGADYVELHLSFNEPITKVDLTKTGYNFTNWTDKAGATAQYPIKCDFKEMELYANWSAITYNVRYYANGGIFANGSTDYVDDTNIAYDSSYNVKQATEISRNHWAFGGWEYSDINGQRTIAPNTPVSNLTNIDKDTVELNAIWTPDNYTITLHQVDPAGNAIKADTITNYNYGDNERISTIASKVVTIAGVEYEWTGWAVASDRTKVKYFAHNSADAIYEIEANASIDLYPVWVEKDKLVYVTFDGNKGTVNGTSKWTVGFATGSELVYPVSNTVKRKGFTHNGWLDSDKTTAFTKTIVDFANDKTIFANWAPGDYTIEFVAIGDDVENAMSNQVVNTAAQATLNANQYKRPGYSFIGWDTDPHANTVIYEDKYDITEPLADVGDTIKLYTVWKANTYTITYKDRDDNLIGTNTLIYGGNVTLLNNTNIPIGQKDTGFDLVGHAGVHFGSGETVTGKDLKITSSTDLATGIVLRGTTEKIVYIITFDANTGKFPDGRVIASAAICYGDSVYNVAPGEPTNAPKQFTGYTVDGTYRDYKTITYDYTRSVTFFADWDGSLYKIEFNDNVPISPDASLINEIKGPVLATQSGLAGKDTGLNNYLRTIKGYTFIGWATASYTAKEAENMKANKDSRIINGNPPVVNWNVPDGSIITLYAMWTRNKYRLTLAQNETVGKVADPYKGDNYEIYYDELISDNSAFAPKTRNGYTFSGMFVRNPIALPYDKKNYNGTDHYTLTTVNREIKDLVLYPLWYNNEKVIKMTLDPKDAEFPQGTTNTTFVGYYDAPIYIQGAPGEPKYNDGSLIKPIATPYEIKLFNYWSSVKGDKTTKIDENTIYDGSYDEIFGNVRYREEYLLTFNPNGGKGTMDAQVMREGISVDTHANEFNKTGYVFSGWKDQYGNSHDNGFTIENPSGALTLAAQWSRYTSGGGSTGGGGGAMNSVKGLLQQETLPEFSLQTAIPLQHYRFLLDGTGSPTSIMLRKDSPIGKIMTSATEYSSKYKLITNYPDYIMLRNGFYNLQRADGPYYYNVDDNGKIRVGFVKIDPLQLYVANTKINKLEKIGEVRGGKYYLLNTKGLNRGVIYILPIVVDGVRYVFDESGRVVSESTETQTQWIYNPKVHKWAYWVTDANGNKSYYKDGAYPIKGAYGQTYYYIFDKDGYMMTGFVEFNGKTYYLAESGVLKGAIMTGNQIINGRKYTFDSSGAMIMPQVQSLKK